MKNTFFIIAILTILTSSFYFYGCRKKQENEISKAQKIKNPSQLKTAGNCNCDPSYTNPYCQECVWKFLGGGATSKEFTVNWTGCSSTDPLWTNNCIGNGQSNLYSHIKFCYGSASQQGGSSDCNLYMEIDYVPPCVAECQPVYPYCIKYKVQCNPNGNDFDVTLIDEDPAIAATITYTISGDPQISICCKKVISGHTYSYCCTGTF